MTVQAIPSTPQLLSDQIFKDIQHWVSGKEPIEQAKKMISNPEFEKDPQYYTATLLINRGVGHYCIEDPVRAIIVKNVPQFLEYLESKDNLKNFAAKRYENHPDKDRILKTFQISVNSYVFHRDLNSVIRDLRNPQSEYSIFAYEPRLRQVLDIFNRAEKFEVYI
jgi:hypothetical protein